MLKGVLLCMDFDKFHPPSQQEYDLSLSQMVKALWDFFSKPKAKLKAQCKCTSFFRKIPGKKNIVGRGWHENLQRCICKFPKQNRASLTARKDQGIQLVHNIHGVTKTSKINSPMCYYGAIPELDVISMQLKCLHLLFCMQDKSQAIISQ